MNVGRLALLGLLVLLASGCTAKRRELVITEPCDVELDPLGACDDWLLNQREGARPPGCKAMEE